MATCFGGNVVENQNTQDFWNYVPSKPVTCTLAVFPSWDQTEILRTARTTLTTSVQCLSLQQQLTSEYHVLSRLIYMKHGQLRREKSFQGLKQIHSCLKKLFSYGLEKVVKEFHSDFENAVLEEGIQARLPSRQMWEYLLTHFLGAAALLSNIASRCTAVFLHVHRHLTTGNLIPTNMVFLSMLSRIWVCCEALCLNLQTWYQGLMPARDVLASTEFAWLPQGQDLPSDLSVWLTEQNLSAGLPTHELDEGEAVSDGLAALMEMCHQKGSKESVSGLVDSTGRNGVLDESLPVAMDETLPLSLDEDLGDPVDISAVERRSGEKWPITGEPAADHSRRVSRSFQKKIFTAPTIQDLQLLLKEFTEQFPGSTTNKRHKKCAYFLTTRDVSSQELQMKGQPLRAQKLLAQCRMKLLMFIKSSSQAINFSCSQNATGVAEKGKKKKKKEKVAMAGDAGDSAYMDVDVSPATNDEKKKKTANVSNAVGTEPVSKSKKKSKTCLNDSTAVEGIPAKSKEKNKVRVNESVNTEAASPAKTKQKKKKERVNDDTNGGDVLPAKRKKKKKLVNDDINTEAISPAKRKQKKNKECVNDDRNTDVLPAKKKKKKKLVNDDISTETISPAKRKQKKKKGCVNDDTNGDVLPAKRKKKKKLVNDDISTEAVSPAKRKQKKECVNDDTNTDVLPAKRKKKLVNDDTNTEAISPAKRKQKKNREFMTDDTNDDVKTEAISPAKRKQRKNKEFVNDDTNDDLNTEAVGAMPFSKSKKKSKTCLNDSTATVGIPAKSKEKNKALVTESVNTEAISPVKIKHEKNKEFVNDGMNEGDILPTKRKQKKNKKLVTDDSDIEVILPAKGKEKNNKKLVSDDMNTDAIPANRKLKRKKSCVNDSENVDAILPERTPKKRKLSASDGANMKALQAKRSKKAEKKARRHKKSLSVL